MMKQRKLRKNKLSLTLSRISKNVMQPTRKISKNKSKKESTLLMQTTNIAEMFRLKTARLSKTVLMRKRQDS